MTIRSHVAHTIGSPTVQAQESQPTSLRSPCTPAPREDVKPAARRLMPSCTTSSYSPLRQADHLTFALVGRLCPGSSAPHAAPHERLGHRLEFRIMPLTWVDLRRFELLTSCMPYELPRSMGWAGHRLMCPLPAAIVAGCGLASPGAWRRWLPAWLPRNSLASLMFDYSNTLRTADLDAVGARAGDRRSSGRKANLQCGCTPGSRHSGFLVADRSGALSRLLRKLARRRCPGQRPPAGPRRSAGQGWPGWRKRRTGCRRKPARSAG